MPPKEAQANREKKSETVADRDHLTSNTPSNHKIASTPPKAFRNPRKTNSLSAHRLVFAVRSVSPSQDIFLSRPMVAYTQGYTCRRTVGGVTSGSTTVIGQEELISPPINTSLWFDWLKAALGRCTGLIDHVAEALQVKTLRSRREHDVPCLRRP